LSSASEACGTPWHQTAVGAEMRFSARTVALRHDLTPRAIALELRRQERGSDFTGYTENHTFAELVRFIEEAGGQQWRLSQVPLSRIRCWNTRTPVARLLSVIASDERGTYHLQKIRRLAEQIHRGRSLPGIVVTMHSRKPAEHWILSGYRRLAAHRVAHAATILVYHPADLFDELPRASDRPSWRRRDRSAFTRLAQ